jgi:hypothetical protein
LHGGHAPPLPGACRSPNCFAISIGTSIFEFELMSIRLLDFKRPPFDSAMKPIFSNCENVMVMCFASCHDPLTIERISTTAKMYLAMVLVY